MLFLCNLSVLLRLKNIFKCTYEVSSLGQWNMLKECEHLFGSILGKKKPGVGCLYVSRYDSSILMSTTHPVKVYEPRCDKTGLRGFRPGPTQTRLYSHWRWLEAWNFVFRMQSWSASLFSDMQKAGFLITRLISAIMLTHPYGLSCEKTILWGFWWSPTESGLYNHRRWIQA